MTEFYVTFFAGIISVILLQYLYFKSQPHHPDGHALRRSRISGSLFGSLIQIYSAALIVVGVSYKMLLTEYKYELKVQATYNYQPSSIVGRVLAGDDAKSKYDMEDRRQRIAYFFCAGLSTVFASLDLMNLAHNGIKPSIDRCSCSRGRLRVRALLFVVGLRLVIILFTATACLYVNEPEIVALVGLAAILLQVFIRIIGSFFFPSQRNVHAHDEHNVMDETKSDGQQHRGQPNMVDKEVNEDHWPNTSQAMSIPDNHAVFRDE